MGCSASKAQPIAGCYDAFHDGTHRTPLSELPPYEPAPLPFEEQNRLEALRRLNILDTPPDPRLDDITKLLCNIFQMPMSLISLVDSYRCWLKSNTGLELREANRQHTFCSWTIIPAHADMLVVEDAHKNARFMNCPLVVGPPYVRFYAAVPLITSTGYLLGALCIIDTKARKFDAEKCNILANFGEIVVREIEKSTDCYVQTRLASQQAAHLLRTLDCFSEGIIMCRLRNNTAEVLYVNSVWPQLTGLDDSQVLGKCITEFADITGKDGPSILWKIPADRKPAADVRMRLKDSGKCFSVSFRSAQLGHLNDGMPLAGIPSTIPWDPKAQGHGLYFATFKPIKRGLDGVAEQLHGQQKTPIKKSFMDDVPFDGCVLGPIVGCGSFGKVYRGSYYGTPVAVKMVEAKSGEVSCGGDKPSKQLEESLFDINLAHPNIVKTYKIASRTVMVPMSSPTPSSPTTVCFRNNSEESTNSGSTNSGSESFDGQWRSDTSCETKSEAVTDKTPASVDSETVDEDKSVSLSFDTNSMYSVQPVTEMWLLMEYCELGTLTSAIENYVFRKPKCDPAGAVDLEAIVQTAREIASVLSYLHSRNIIHGDLTGGNVLLTAGKFRDFTAKVSDFGLSRIANDGYITTQTFGTASHMPPEMMSDGKLSKAVDVYAFGVILWEMYNGQRAWSGMQPVQIMFNVAVMRKVLEFKEDCPCPLFKDLVTRCVAADPEKRPTCDEILDTLEEIYPSGNL